MVQSSNVKQTYLNAWMIRSSSALLSNQSIHKPQPSLTLIGLGPGYVVHVHIPMQLPMGQVSSIGAMEDSSRKVQKASTYITLPRLTEMPSHEIRSSRGHFPVASSYGGRRMKVPGKGHLHHLLHWRRCWCGRCQHDSKAAATQECCRNAGSGIGRFQVVAATVGKSRS